MARRAMHGSVYCLVPCRLKLHTCRVQFLDSALVKGGLACARRWQGTGIVDDDTWHTRLRVRGLSCSTLPAPPPPPAGGASSPLLPL